MGISISVNRTTTTTNEPRYQCKQYDKFPFHRCFDDKLDALNGLHTYNEEDRVLKGEFKDGVLEKGNAYFNDASVALKVDNDKKIIEVTGGDSDELFKGQIDSKLELNGILIESGNIINKGTFSVVTGKPISAMRYEYNNQCNLKDKSEILDAFQTDDMMKKCFILI